jgi:restriction endonuclease Mrr
MKMTTLQDSSPAAATLELAMLQSLGKERFEDVCAAAYKHSGYFVEPTGLGPDYGIDLIMATVGKGGFADDWVAMRSIFSGEPVTAREIQTFIDAMESEGFARGILVTTGDILPEAAALADRQEDIQLVDGGTFLTQLDRLPEAGRREVVSVATGV